MASKAKPNKREKGVKTENVDAPDPLFLRLSTQFKNKFVYKFFWGRGTLYKTTLHSSIIIVTFAILVSGISSSFQNTTDNATFDNSVIPSGDIDLLEQGASVQSVLKTDRIRNFEVFVHKVAKGEDLDKIAEKYQIEKRGIIDSNRDKIDFYTEEVTEGDTLRIPPINGVLYDAKAEDNIDNILEKFEGGNKFDVIELNNLKQPDFEITEGQELIIVSAQLPAPPKPEPEVIYVAPQVTLATNPGNANVVYGSDSINGLSFSSPVSHPSCAGWGFSRGYTGPYYLGLHDGLDISRGGGCVLVASASGLVNFAGWSNGGQGFLVKISHGNGLESQYFHGSGEFYVKPGEYVSAGQPIMYMGNSGNSYGTHLHYSLFLNGNAIDPSPYTKIF